MQLTDKEYNLVKKYVSPDIDPIPMEELESVTIIYTDNLIGRYKQTWAKSALVQMESLLPGCPVLEDHDWDNTGEAIGVALTASLYKVPTAPKRAIGELDKTLNQGIIDADGWLPLVGKLAIRKDSEVYRNLQEGSSGKISIGGFKTTQILCGACKKSFFSPDCPHTAPGSGWMSDENTAPYLIRKDSLDMGEVSFCVIPVCLSAGVIIGEYAGLFPDLFENS